MSSTECPTCGRDDFASKGSMRSHHARIHDESLREVVELSCDWCGTKYETPSYKEDESRFCSGSCRSKSIGANRKSQPNTRDVALKRDDYTCQRCGCEVEKGHRESQRSAEVHHLVPRAAGGPDAPENLVTLCLRCHKAAHQEMGRLHHTAPELLDELRAVVCEDDR